MVIGRRRFVGGVALGFVLAPLDAYAQRATKVPRVGLLTVLPLDAPISQAALDAFRKGLREHGYVEGQNIVVEYRSAGGKFDEVPALASELARLKVEVIVVGSTQMARATQQGTTIIPIVAVLMGDPVRDGIVASLARPGGNVTGLTYLGPELVLKRLELLKNMVPTASRIAALWHRDAFGEETMKVLRSEAEAAARTIGVQLQFVEVHGSDDLDQAFSAIVRERPDALLVFPSVVLFSEQQRIVEFAATHRLPAMHFVSDFVMIGGLISYGPSPFDLYRRSAAYVDKILKGEKPGNLPIEQPTNFELAVNVKSAKALGITIPQLVLLRADRVIQ